MAESPRAAAAIFQPAASAVSKAWPCAAQMLPAMALAITLPPGRKAASVARPQCDRSKAKTPPRSEAVPFAVETNLRRALEAAKAAGLWILGSSEHAERSVEDIPRDRPWLLVVGNEEDGLRRLTLETCDEVCQIAPKGEAVTSLNVSVATGILIATLSRG